MSAGARLIFHIDDDPDILAITGEILRQFSRFKVRSFTSATSALSEIENDIPDLILLDLAMPFVDGLIFIKMLREHCMGEIPVILLTAKPKRADYCRIERIGVIGTIAKPFDCQSLVERIDKYWSAYQISVDMPLSEINGL